MADSKDIEITNFSRGMRTLYDANNNPVNVNPGQSAKLSLNEAQFDLVSRMVEEPSNGLRFGSREEVQQELAQEDDENRMRALQMQQGEGNENIVEEQAENPEKRRRR